MSALALTSSQSQAAHAAGQKTDAPTGQPSTQPAPLSEDHIKQLHDEGELAATLLLSAMHESRGEVQEAFRLTLYAAEIGYPPAMVEAGRMLLTGVHAPADHAAALEWLRKAEPTPPSSSATKPSVQVDANPHAHPAALAWLGYAHQFGMGVEGNETAARRFYERGAAANDPTSQAFLALMYADGVSVVANPRRAWRILKPALDLNHPQAQAVAAELNYFGQGVERNFAEARRLYLLAAKPKVSESNLSFPGLAHVHPAPVPHAYRELAIMSLYPPEAYQEEEMEEEEFETVVDGSQFQQQPSAKDVTPDALLAAEYFATAAQLGDVPSMLRLAYLLKEGVRTRQGARLPSNPRLAMLYFEKAASWGSEDDKLAYANLLSEGIDHSNPALAFSAKPEQAYVLFKQLAEAGNVQAQLSLAEAYYMGAGTKADAAKAAGFYAQAAQNGDGTASCALGTLYLNGKGVPADPSAAVLLFRKAIEEGHTCAHVQLGKLYAQGRGVEKSNAKAVYHYRIAALDNNWEAMELLADCYAKGRGVEKNARTSAAWAKRARAAQSNQQQQDR